MYPHNFRKQITVDVCASRYDDDVLTAVHLRRLFSVFAAQISTETWFLARLSRAESEWKQRAEADLK